MALHVPNTGDALASQDAGSVRELWKKGVEMFEQSTDFYGPFEGTNESYPIHSERDTSKGGGHKITFTVQAGFHHEAIIGDNVIADADYEKIKTGSNELTVEFMRHATQYTIRAEEKMGMRGELMKGLPQQQAQWFGREKTDRLNFMWLHRGTSENQRYAGNKSSVNALRIGDTFKHNTLIENSQILRTMNGKPAHIGRDAGKNPIKGYCWVATTESLTALKLDTDYQRATREADVRGDDQIIFKGGYKRLDGSVINEYNPYDHDGYGAIGSVLSPKARLGNTLASADVASEIKGGGSATAAALTQIKYFKYFPNYAYQYNNEVTLTVSGTSYYVIIKNITGADAGKWGMYSYTTNNGNKLTINGALKNGTDLGNVTWDAAQNTNDHPIGSEVVLVNSSGVPYQHVIAMGAGAARRGYGMYDKERSTDEQEGGFLKQLYMTSVFGQEPRKDANGACPGFLVVTCAIHIPGWGVTPELLAA